MTTAGIGAMAAEGRAQSRPLQTQDPTPVGLGQMLIDLGVDYHRDEFYPVSGLAGNLTKWGTFDLSFGVSSIAEIQLNGGFYNRLIITSRSAAPLASLVTAPADSTGDVEDGAIGAKVRFHAESARSPALAVRFSTRLPNSKHPSGLGLDTTDFYFGILTGKTVGGWRVAGNLGLGILNDPVQDGIQNDVLTYGGSVTRRLTPALEATADVNGRADTRHNTPPIGTESRAVWHAGVRCGRDAVRFDVAVLGGLTSRDPTWGITSGVTWVFHAFAIQ